jgi:hypothetical protein
MQLPEKYKENFVGNLVETSESCIFQLVASISIEILFEVCVLKGNGNINFYILIWKNFWKYILTSFTLEVMRFI